MDVPANLGAKITEPAFCDRVRQMSGGRLDITLYTADQLVPTGEIASALQRGVIEMAFTASPYYSGSIPVANLDGLAGFYKDPQQLFYLYEHMGLNDLLRKGYAESGIYYLTPVLIGPTTLISRKPISGIDGLKNVKIISGSPALGRLLTYYGASVTNIPQAERYSALATGIADGLLTALPYYESQQFYEVCPYLYNWDAANPCTNCLLISMSAWNALPDDLKAIVYAAGKLFSEEHYWNIWFANMGVLKNLDKWGSKVVVWSDDDIAKLAVPAMEELKIVAAKGAICAEGVEIYKKFAEWRGLIK
jgi:TRAP-type C4-dicarboxylate transport system substrate-binding protein